MDTLSIIQKLKKKRPDLASDPLFSELEAAQMEEEMPMEGDAPMDASYLDAVGGKTEAPMEGDADALMAELDAEEGMETGADALAEDDFLGEEAEFEGEAEGESKNYLDEEEEEEEEEMIAKPRRGGRTGSRS